MKAIGPRRSPEGYLATIEAAMPDVIVSAAVKRRQGDQYPEAADRHSAPDERTML